MGLYTSTSHEFDLHAIDFFVANPSLKGQDICHGGSISFSREAWMFRKFRDFLKDKIIKFNMRFLA